ncbi:hypothetical protein BDN67DRAFT_968314 [Paxillus ammoniavirescens]|nr:hypothetical protein BDN67DRAFT_968314 [Paxillus ammoniavirescens]
MPHAENASGFPYGTLFLAECLLLLVACVPHGKPEDFSCMGWALLGTVFMTTR